MSFVLYPWSKISTLRKVEARRYNKIPIIKNFTYAKNKKSLIEKVFKSKWSSFPCPKPSVFKQLIQLFFLVLISNRRLLFCLIRQMTTSLINDTRILNTFITFKDFIFTQSWCRSMWYSIEERKLLIYWQDDTTCNSFYY